MCRSGCLLDPEAASRFAYLLSSIVNEATAYPEIGYKGLVNKVLRRYGLRVRTCAMDRNMQK
jgi:hypothetical protein